LQSLRKRKEPTMLIEPKPSIGALVRDEKQQTSVFLGTPEQIKAWEERRLRWVPNLDAFLASGTAQLGSALEFWSSLRAYMQVNIHKSFGDAVSSHASWVDQRKPYEPSFRIFPWYLPMLWSSMIALNQPLQPGEYISKGKEEMQIFGISEVEGMRLRLYDGGEWLERARVCKVFRAHDWLDVWRSPFEMVSNVAAWAEVFEASNAKIALRRDSLALMLIAYQWRSFGLVWDHPRQLWTSDFERALPDALKLIALRGSRDVPPVE
jgi:hypothetical protein